MDFQNFPGPLAFFQDFPVLENAKIKFQDFPGFPGPVRTLEMFIHSCSFIIIHVCSMSSIGGQVNTILEPIST